MSDCIPRYAASWIAVNKFHVNVTFCNFVAFRALTGTASRQTCFNPFSPVRHMYINTLSGPDYGLECYLDMTGERVNGPEDALPQIASKFTESVSDF